jgi:hypothetical protein
MKRHKHKLRRRYGRSHSPRPHGEYESKASYQQCYVSHVTDGTVFFRLTPQGSSGFMPVREFKKLYRPVGKAAA